MPKGKFNIKFKEIWNEVIYINVQNQYYDSNGVLENDGSLYRQLFDRNVNGEFGFSESVKLFLSWWNGFYGKIAIERLFESEGGQEIYNELSKSLILYNLNNSQFKINIIYDKQQLFSTTSSLSYAVLPIQELFLNRTEIVSNLLEGFENP
ncbi:group-specific protein [Lysinibacillus sp. NPDC056959]|uniref:group-specific protein n=1 Tax=Lysinibacillus sp. NPDC056959 TaxID=3345981 RepID=UPI003631104E